MTSIQSQDKVEKMEMQLKLFKVDNAGDLSKGEFVAYCELELSRENEKSTECESICNVILKDESTGKRKSNICIIHKIKLDKNMPISLVEIVIRETCKRLIDFSVKAGERVILN